MEFPVECPSHALSVVSVLLVAGVGDAAAAGAARSTAGDAASRSRRRLLFSRELARGTAGAATQQRLQLVAEVLVHERVDERIGDVVDEVQVEHEDVVRHQLERNQRSR